MAWYLVEAKDEASIGKDEKQRFELMDAKIIKSQMKELAPATPDKVAPNCPECNSKYTNYMRHHPNKIY